MGKLSPSTRYKRKRSLCRAACTQALHSPRWSAHRHSCCSYWSSIEQDRHLPGLRCQPQNLYPPRESLGSWGVATGQGHGAGVRLQPLKAEIWWGGREKYLMEKPQRDDSGIYGSFAVCNSKSNEGLGGRCIHSLLMKTNAWAQPTLTWNLQIFQEWLAAKDCSWRWVITTRMMTQAQ